MELATFHVGQNAGNKLNLHLQIMTFNISDPTGKKRHTSHVATSANTKQAHAMVFASKKTVNFVAMIPALNLELGTTETTENVEIVVFTNLNSAQVIPTHALKIIILVERMTMDDVLMTTRVIATLNVVIGVFGAVNGHDITTYHVETSAYTGSYFNIYKNL